MIEALLEAWSLKALPRAGWVRMGIAAPESVAAHSWGIAALVLQLLPAELDLGRALTYAALHDLPEVRTGDITPADGVAVVDKHRAEDAAMAALCADLPRGDELLATWRRYEAQSDDESRFVRQLDRLDMALQALVYERRTGTDLGEFYASAARVIEHPALREVFDALLAAR